MYPNNEELLHAWIIEHGEELLNALKNDHRSDLFNELKDFLILDSCSCTKLFHGRGVQIFKSNLCPAHHNRSDNSWSA